MTLLVLILRLLIASIFIWAGTSKLGHADVFAEQIAAFGLVPRPLIAPIAIVLPFVEILLGGYLAIGLYTRLAAIIAVIQLTIFATAIGSAVVRGLSLSCGCFGPQDHTVTSWPEVARDIAFAGIAAVVAWQAPGMLALDHRFKKIE